jgi:thiol-disulfide isomerase/thioredoxin
MTGSVRRGVRSIPRPGRILGAVLASAAALALLAGCTQSVGSSPSQGYVSGSGEYKEIKPANRLSPVTFTARLDTGKTITSASLLGTVHVLNFWYAGCGPCIQEAPLLEKVYNSYDGKVPFIGVNTYDQAPTAQEFERDRKVTYPSVIDVNTTSVQYAFSKKIPTNAVPTTLVIDKHGRVAARVTGEVTDASILTALIKTVIAEGQ